VAHANTTQHRQAPHTVLLVALYRADTSLLSGWPFSGSYSPYSTRQANKAATNHKNRFKYYKENITTLFSKFNVHVKSYKAT